MRELLEQLEAGPPGALLPTLAWLAGQDVELDADERYAALRRAELLLAAGGDPHRELELDGRAVTAVADDLDEPSARAALLRGSRGSQARPRDFRRSAEHSTRLRTDPDLAWRSYACALLAEALAGD